MCGDATKPEHVERLLDGAKPDLMVTDPPYGVTYDASWRDGLGYAAGRARGAISPGGTRMPASSRPAPARAGSNGSTVAGTRWGLDLAPTQAPLRSHGLHLSLRYEL